MDPSLRAFADLAHAADAEIDLGLAALTVARVEYPDLVPAKYLDRLDDLARRVGAGGARDPRTALDRLRKFLFDAEGFRGNADDYYDPRNSCLNDVLDRGLGIPITLSVLIIEVGRRLGLRIDGIGLPGHFVVSVHVGSREILLDPFDGGSVLTVERAAAVVSRAVGRPVQLAEAHWAPCTKRQILIRMLRNLKTCYAQRESWEQTLAVIDRLRLLDPESPTHLRDHGTVLVKLGRLYEGAADWERYLVAFPQAQDAENFRRELRRIRQELAARN
jgi:regulator of sirC expression with transglutaminase-like and TPR domain